MKEFQLQLLLATSEWFCVSDRFEIDRNPASTKCYEWFLAYKHRCPDIDYDTFYSFAAKVILLALKEIPMMN